METAELTFQDFELVNDFELDEELIQKDQDFTIDVSGLGNVSPFKYAYNDICPNAMK